MNIKNRLKAWLGIIALEQENKTLRAIIARQSDRISDRISELDKLTAVDADIGVRGPCTVILSGVYRGRGYVSFYEMDHNEFRNYVERMRADGRSGLLRNIDAHPEMMAAFSL